MTCARADDRSGGAFAVAGDRWKFEGTLTFDDAAGVLEATSRLPWPASDTVDLSGLVRADSAALAVMLALRRRGAQEGRAIAFVAIPPAVESLARVYGIEDVFVASS